MELKWVIFRCISQFQAVRFISQLTLTQVQYSPAAIIAALSQAKNATSRTVYFGNLPAASVDELLRLNLVHFGPSKSIRVLPEKSCIFLSLLDGPTAAQFYADAVVPPRNNNLRICATRYCKEGLKIRTDWGNAACLVTDWVMRDMVEPDTPRARAKSSKFWTQAVRFFFGFILNLLTTCVIEMCLPSQLLNGICDLDSFEL